MQGIAAKQHDAWDIGMTTTDDFTQAEVLYEETLPAVQAALTRPPGAPRELPIVTGFLGRGLQTGVARSEPLQSNPFIDLKPGFTTKIILV